jgi:GTP-binding protein
MKAANFALNAWVETAEANGGEVVPSKPDPSERAWDIIRSLQIASTPLLLPAEAAGDIYELGSTPDVTTYLLALRICGRVKSKKSLEVALKILDAVEKEGLITKGSICTTLLKAINNSSDIEQRIKATKQVYEAALKEEPNLKKSVREAFSKNIGYFRNIHPALFEEHFGELDLSLLEPSLEVQDQYQLSRSTDFNSISSLSVSSSSDYGRRGIHTQCAPIDNPFNHSFDNNVSYQNFTTSSSQVSFVVSILGPPNAGKSTLFNRLQCKESNKSYRLGSGKGKSRRRGGKDYDDSIRGRIASRHTSKGGAIVSPEAGTTRDRRECWGRIGGTEFRLMDTAGVDGDRIQTWNDNVRSSKKISKSEEQAMEQAMMEQTMKAAQQSDLVLLLWDARVGVTHDLLETARWLRKLGKHTNVVILANKLEGDAWAQDGESPVMEHLNDVLHLGLGEAIPISALHGEGMADLALIIEQLKGKKQLDQDELFTHGMPKATLPSNDSKPLQIAIIGRQNVGKSTLVNTLLEDQRVLTGPTPGLTRDAIAVEWVSEDGQGVQIVDTAGIQKLTKRKDDAIEDMSVADALRAMKTAEVAVLVLDAEAMYIQRLELALCNAVIEEGRALVVAANKMDLLEFSNDYTPQHFMEAVREQLETRIPMLRKTPIVPMSCVTGEGVSDLLPTSKDARDRWAQTFPTGVLNRWLREVIDSAPLPVVSGVRAKLKYIIQTKGRPPTFIIFANVDQLPDSYLRYLTKQFQDSFELFGMPVRLLVKRSAKSNPYERRQQKRGGFGLGGREARMQRRVSDLRQKRRRSKKDNQ